MEVLAARHRLGEPFWPIAQSPAHTLTLKQLKSLGLVEYEHGRASGFWEAQLTPRGRREYMTGSYRSPAATMIYAVSRHTRIGSRELEGVYSNVEAAQAAFPNAVWNHHIGYKQRQEWTWEVGDMIDSVVHIREGVLRG